MPRVDIDRASKLDKIHIKRMQHAFSQILHALIGLEDERVNAILDAYSICIMPGMHAGVDYAGFAKQILADELNIENALAAQESKKKPSSAKKRVR